MKKGGDEMQEVPGRTIAVDTEEDILDFIKQNADETEWT